jgi:hypothetical protein
VQTRVILFLPIKKGPGLELRKLESQNREAGLLSSKTTLVLHPKTLLLEASTNIEMFTEGRKVLTLLCLRNLGL